jgi:hypothetical protein
MPADIETPESGGGDDRRNDVAAALEQAEAASPSPAEAPPPAPVESAEPAPSTETPEETSARLRDEKGRFAKAAEDKVAVLTPSENKTPVQPTPPTDTAPVEPAKAPASWKALAREEWAKTPPAIQQEVLRRERETSVALEQSSEARQGYQRWKEVVGPYEAAIRADGADPHTVVQSLLQTTAALATGPVPRRAAIIADLIRTYLPGKESLEMLDSTLAGVLAGRPATSTAPPQYQDPRVDEIYQTFQQAKQRQAATLEQQAIEGVREIQGEEFYEDVKLIAADMLEVAGNQGLALTPREAYNRAVALHPEVSKVVQQREAAKHAANPTGSTARARAAASSIRGSPATSPSSAVQPDDLRGVLEAAFDRAGR